MYFYSLANIIRENQDEVIRRWLENLSGHIAEEFEQMMHTPMGTKVAQSLIKYVVEFMGGDGFEEGEVVHNVRNVARESSFRRSAVGFCLPDIVFTALAFRRALEETLLNHVVHSNPEEEHQLLEGLLQLNRLADAIISGEIAGYFEYRDFHEIDEGEQQVA